MEILGRERHTKKAWKALFDALNSIVELGGNRAKGPYKLGQKPGTYVLFLPKDIDKNTVPILRREIAPLFKSGVIVQLILDLSGVSYIDSAGIATLVEWLGQSKKEKARLILAGVSPEVRAILDRENLRDIFEEVPQVKRLSASSRLQ